ncbi:MAG: AAA family ATPase, partial [Candidatus Hodgkinia cicadicola]
MNVYRLSQIPDKRINVKAAFGLNIQACLPCFSTRNTLVPHTRFGFQFEKHTTLCILAGLIYNRRVLIVGQHGTGKSTHIEQVCSRLNWACVRINMDSCLSRLELIGRESIAKNQGKPTIKFKYGLLPWAVKRPIALVLDDYDACKPETKFVLNKLLETGGEISVPENGKIIRPCSSFRMIATCNTLSGSYAGTYQENIAHLDRWSLVANAPDLDVCQELALAKQVIKTTKLRHPAVKIVELARLLRKLHAKGKLSMPLTIRGVLAWSELSIIFNSIGEAFKYAYLNKCILSERQIVRSKYSEVFGTEC